MRKILQAGMSLVELMIGGALLAGVGLVAGEMFKQQSGTAKYAVVREELDSFHNILSKMLLDHRHCNANFHSYLGETTVSSSSLSEGISQCCTNASSNPTCTINSVACISSSTNWAQDKKLYIVKGHGIGTEGAAVGGFKLLEAELKDDVTVASGSALKQATISVTYELISTNIEGPRRITKDIPVALKFADGVGFVGCVDEQQSSKNTLQREICAGMNPNFVTYNEVTGVCERKADADVGCTGNDVLKGFHADGSPECGPAEDAEFDPSAVVQNTTDSTCNTTSTVQFYLNPANNKIEVRCTPPATSPGGGGSDQCTPANGTWGPWSDWSSCGTSGTQTKSRQCNNPCGGEPCVGSDTETRQCTCLPNGTICGTPGLCNGNSCSSCCSAPSNTCSAPTSGGWGRCGESVSCGAAPMCM